MFRAPPVCLVVGDNQNLAANVIWSLPAERVEGFVLVGPRGLRRLATLPGCLGHIEIDLDETGVQAIRDYLHGMRDRRVLGLAVDDAGCDLLADHVFEGLMVAPLARAEVLAALRDKWRFYQLCRRLDLPTPPTEWSADKRAIDIEAVFARLGRPLVIKPVDQKGGVGVVIVSTAQDFRRLVLDNAGYQFAPLIAQAYVAGRDMGFSLLAQNGRIGHHAIQVLEGADIRFLDHPALLHAVQALVSHVGFEGLANIDARWRPDGGVELLECNTRPWASLRRPAWCGLNFIRAALDAAEGRSSLEPAALSQCVAPSLAYWVLRLPLHPWRLMGLRPDQRRLVRGLFSDLVRLKGKRRRLLSHFNVRGRDRHRSHAIGGLAPLRLRAAVVRPSTPS